MQTLAFGDEAQAVARINRPPQTLTNQVEVSIPQLFVLLGKNHNMSQEVGVFLHPPGRLQTCPKR
jgi:hypothetical protein